MWRQQKKRPVIFKNTNFLNNTRPHSIRGSTATWPMTGQRHKRGPMLRHSTRHRIFESSLTSAQRDDGEPCRRHFHNTNSTFSLVFRSTHLSRQTTVAGVRVVQQASLQPPPVPIPIPCPCDQMIEGGKAALGPSRPDVATNAHAAETTGLRRRALSTITTAAQLSMGELQPRSSRLGSQANMRRESSPVVTFRSSPFDFLERIAANAVEESY